MNSFKVLHIDRADKSVTIAFGPIQFKCFIQFKEDGSFFVSKPASIYVDKADFVELISTVKRAWNNND